MSVKKSAANFVLRERYRRRQKPLEVIYKGWRGRKVSFRSCVSVGSAEIREVPQFSHEDEEKSSVGRWSARIVLAYNSHRSMVIGRAFCGGDEDETRKTN